MRTTSATQPSPLDAYREALDDALSYATYVLAQPGSRQRRQQAQALLELAQSWKNAPQARPKSSWLQQRNQELMIRLSTLRGSVPSPRPLSFVRFDPMALLPGQRHEMEQGVRALKNLLFLGEHPNMPRHGVVIDLDSQRMYPGVHVNELVEVRDDDETM